MRRTQLAPGVYRYSNGEIGVDEDTLLNFMGDVDAELGDDEVGDDDIGDDDIGDEVGDDEVGDAGKRYARRKKRLDRFAKRKGIAQPKQNWGATILADQDVIAAAGSCAVALRLQHDFRAEDLALAGSDATAKVTSIFFGDKMIWQNVNGVPASLFATTGFLRGFLRGQTLRAGLDIIVNGTISTVGGGTFAVQVTGYKPASC